MPPGSAIVGIILGCGFIWAGIRAIRRKRFSSQGGAEITGFAAVAVGAVVFIIGVAIVVGVLVKSAG